VTVYLVGAGPGDPGLVTLRAEELLAHADVVVHDRLVDISVLAMSARGAELIDVGKFRGGQSLTQSEINSLLIERGRGSQVVVRLKGGDPFLFGRGGEEAAALADAGVPYEVVPGVSSFSAVPGAAGVPLTMRGLSSSVLLVTGHDPEALDQHLPDAAIAAAETIVVLMGGETRRVLAKRLIEAGKSPSTPVLVVEAGTTPEQRSRRTTLEKLEELEVRSPVTLVVGEVAALNFSSYEQRPLFGWRVVVTRAESQAAEFAQALVRLGAVPILLPTIEIVSPADGGAALRAAVGRIQEFEWVVLSSANAVDAFFAELPDARALAGVKMAVIGDRTAAAVRTYGVVADLVPKRFIAEGLAEEFPVATRPDARVLIPRAAVAREVLPDAIRGRGWLVETPTAYETIHPALTREQHLALASGHVVTFASSSSVLGLLAAVEASELPPVVASIGPATTATLVAHGLDVDVEAEEHTTSGLLAALVAYAKDRERPG
jgi:uroporphyrinogen III methyltransferase / synthase